MRARVICDVWCVMFVVCDACVVRCTCVCRDAYQGCVFVCMRYIWSCVCVWVMMHVCACICMELYGCVWHTHWYTYTHTQTHTARYAKDENAFFTDFAKAYAKLVASYKKPKSEVKKQKGVYVCMCVCCVWVALRVWNVQCACIYVMCMCVCSPVCTIR